MIKPLLVSIGLLWSAVAATADDVVLLSSKMDDELIKGGAMVSPREVINGIHVFGFDGNYDRNFGGVFNLNPRANLAGQYYGQNPDAVDFLLVFTGFEFDTGANTQAFYVAVKNDVAGIGLPLFDNGGTFSSTRLQGYIDMAAMSRYSLDSLDPAFDTVLDTALHELMHRWAAGIQFIDHNGFPSDGLLGAGDIHWGEFVDSAASVMGGGRWVPVGGQFEAIEVRQGYHAMELYLAGLLSADSVQPIAYLDGPVGDPQAYWPQVGDVVSATRYQVTAQQVIDIEGPRSPTVATSQKHFNAALVVLLRSGQELSPVRQAELADFSAALERRFHIATGGQASLRFVDDQGSPAAGSPGTLLPPNLPRNGNFDLLAAEGWLLAQQQIDFSWRDADSTARRDTAMAISALDLLNTPGQAGLNAAQFWLDTLPMRHVDDAIWRVIGDEAAGTSTGVGVALIRSNLDLDGGVSLYPDRQGSTVLDSTLALASLGVCDPLGSPGNQAALRVRDYLLSHQRPSGGWPLGGGGDNAELEVTARAIAALFRCGLALNDLESSAIWLAAQQGPDGSFASDHETALAILALSSFGTQFDVEVQAAVSWLGGRQISDGSWGGSVYQTALAVQALDGSQRPNLRARSGLGLEPTMPLALQRVEVSVDVVNASLRPSVASEAHLYLSSISSPASRILLESVPLPALAPQENTVIRFDWDTAGAPADAVLQIELDPNDLVAESNEGDNNVSHSVEFSPSPQIDLQLYRQDIAISPLPVQAYPASLTVNALIRNAGTQSQASVGIEVYLLDGHEPHVALLVDTFAIDALATLQLPMDIDLIAADAPRLRIVLDPQDLLSELNEDNNLVEIDVPIAHSLDLVVADGDLTLPPGPYRVGQAIPVSATFRNVGTQRSAVFGVDVSAQTPIGVDAVSSETTQLSAGEVTVRNWVFTPSTAGTHQVVLELDPLDQVAEQDESNNTAVVSFDVDATSQANLRPVVGTLAWSPNPVLEGQTLQVSVEVENTGDIAAPGFEVHFFDAAPEEGGVQIASSSLAGLMAGQTEQISVVTSEVAGSHDRLLYVQVDPLDSVSEFNEDDNRLFEPHAVMSFPDLSISASGVAMIPAAPLPGEPVTVWMNIDNLGDQASGPFDVSLHEVAGDGQQSMIAVLPVASIAGHATNSVSYDWLASDDSVVALLIELDLGDAVREIREDNNHASAARRVVDREFYLTEPIFSPNGDGRKDTSTIVFDMGQSDDWMLSITDQRGVVVRQFDSPDLTSVSSGAIVWDGRNDRGIVVRDGEYQVRLQAVDSGALRQTTAIVDTNRTPVFEAMATPRLLVTELGCFLDTASAGTLSADGRFIYVTRLKRPTDLTTEQGLFRVDTRNGSIAALARADVLPAGGFQEAVYPLSDGRVVFSNGGTGARGAAVNIWVQEAPFAPPIRLETGTSLGVEVLAVDEAGVLFDGEHGVARVGLLAGDLPELLFMPPPASNPVFATNASGGWLFTGHGADVVGGVNQTTDDLWFVSNDPATPPVRLGFGPSFHWELSVDGRYVAALGKVALYRNIREATLNLWHLEGGVASLNWTRAWTPDPDRDLGISISPRNEVLILDAETAQADLVGPEGRLLGMIDFPTVLFDDYVAAEGLAGHSRGFAHWQGFLPSDHARMSRSFARWSSDEDRFFVEFDLSRQYAGGYSQRAAEKARSAAFKEALTFTDIARLFSVDWRSGQVDLIGNINSTGDATIEFPNQLPYRINPEKLSWLARTDTLLSANFAADAELVDTRSPGLLDLEARYLDAMWPTTHGAVTRKVLFRYRPDWMEATCPGAPDLPVVVESTDNLIADLTARSFASVVELTGTASDRHFESYQLEWARAETPDQWAPLESPKPYQQVSSELTTWVPPDPGEYLIRLTAYDRAGNIETSVDSVHWSDRASLSQVNVEPRYISPNGDGIQEQSVLSFVVREPINVPVTIEDANGVVLRNFLGQYPVVNGAVEAIVWDGRDDAGLIVDDGEYLLRVQSRRYRIVVDTQAPVVSIEALPLRAVMQSTDPPRAHDYVVSQRRVRATADDLSETVLEIHSDAGVSRGQDLMPSPRTFAQSSFFAIATDAAGNRSAESTAATPDVLIRAVNEKDIRVGAHPADGRWIDHAPATEEQILRLAVESSVPQSGAQYQYLVRFRADHAVAWDEVLIAEPQHSTGVPWQVVLPFDTSVVGDWRELDVEVVVQTDAQNVSSNVVKFTRPGLLLTRGGSLELDADVPLFVSVFNAGGNLMGREAFDGDVVWSRLELRSPNDPRFLHNTVIPENSTHAHENSNISAIGWDLPLLPCLRYYITWTVHLEVAGGAPRVMQAHTEFTTMCGEVQIDAAVLTGPQCLEVRTDTVRFSISIAGPNGQYFSHWELYTAVDNGFQLIRNGTGLGQYQLDEFYSNLVFKISDTLGHDQFRAISLPDEPQAVSWNQPTAGDRICAVAPDPHGFHLDLPIDIYRTKNIAASANARHVDSGRPWGAVNMPCSTNQQWTITDCFFPDEQIPEEYRRLRTNRNGSVNSPFDYRPPPSGPYEFVAQGIDVRGAHQCDVVVAEVDASVDFQTLSPVVPWARGGASTADFAISPNGDGAFDQLTLESVALEPLSMDVTVWSYPDDGAVLLDTPLTSRSIDGSWDYSWDGSGLPEGTYRLVFEFTDDCGLKARVGFRVEIDMTPPDLAIVYPQMDSVLGSVVQVTGLYQERNPDTSHLFVEQPDGAQNTLASNIWTSPEIRPLGTWLTSGFGLGVHRVILEATDAVGNAASTEVAIDFTGAQDVIWRLDADPLFFSPNSDGALDFSYIEVGIQNSDVVLDLSVETLGGGLVRTLLDAVTTNPGVAGASWDGLTDFGATVTDGRYVIKAMASETAGAPTLNQSESIEVVVDNTPPIIQLISPSSPFVEGSTSLALRLLDTHLGDSIIELEPIDPPGTARVLAMSDGSISDLDLGDFQGLVDGQYELRVIAEDRAANVSESTTSLTLDTLPPLAALIAPADGAVVGGMDTELEFKGTALDLNLDHFVVEARSAGAAPADPWAQLIWSDQPVDSGSLGSWPISLADGRYDIRLMVEDAAGHQSAVVQTLIIDTTEPTAELTAPIAGSFVRIGDLVTGTANDANFDRFELETSPRDQDTWTPVHVSTDAVTAGTLAELLVLPNDAEISLRLIVTDQVGLQAQAVVDVTVDATPPPIPLNLVAQRIDPYDVQLDWNPVVADDLAHYQVFKNGIELSTTLTTDLLDGDVADGQHQYWVTAVDTTGNASEPSNVVSIRIDRTAPEVALIEPVTDAVVGGMVEVIGTAQAPDDFAEYRLYLRLVSEPPPGNLIAQSPLPVIGGILGGFDSAPLLQDQFYVLRLEAEDTIGNLAVTERQVLIDNLPPAAPNGLTATAQGVRDAQLQWNANSEPDLAGYLLYRDGVLVNGDPNSDIFAALIIDTMQLESELSDGLHTWVVHAVDQARNISPPSDPATLLIETGPPDAVIVTPEPAFRFQSPLFIQATSADLDIADVQFFARPSGGSWQPIGVDNEAPFEANLDAESLGWSYGDIDLQALATDTLGQSDPTPSEVTVEYADLTPPDAPLDLTAQTIGGDINLSWQSSTAADLAGYTVLRSDEGGPFIEIAQLGVVTSHSDTALSDGLYAYQVLARDQADNESLASNQADGRVHTLAFEHPYTPLAIDVFGLEGDSLVPGAVEVTVGGVSVAMMATDVEGRFSLVDIPLALGENTVEFWSIDAGGNQSRREQIVMQRATVPPQPLSPMVTENLGLIDFTWQAPLGDPPIGYRPWRNGASRLPDEVYASPTTVVSSNNPDAWRALDGNQFTFWYPYDADLLSGPPQWFELRTAQPELVSSIDYRWLSSLYAPTEWLVEAWSGYAWIGVATVNDGTRFGQIEFDRPYLTDRVRLRIVDFNRAFFRPVRLAEVGLSTRPLLSTTQFGETVSDGSYSYQATAIGAYGFEGPRSDAATIDVGDVVAPNPVTLSGSVIGADATLNWTASAAGDFAQYVLYRDDRAIASINNAAQLSHVDVGLLDGDYSYHVTVHDTVGNESEPSNSVVLTVAQANIAPPENLQASAGTTEIDISWLPGSGGSPAVYRLERAVDGGPFSVLASPSQPLWQDSAVIVGPEYCYRVYALDAIGNEAGPSNSDCATLVDLQPPTVPALLRPTTPGHPINVDVGFADLAGYSDPGSLVRLYNNGRFVGEVTASTDSDNWYPSVSTNSGNAMHPSPDGRWLFVDELLVGFFYTDALLSLDDESVVELPTHYGSPGWLADSSGLWVSDPYRPWSLFLYDLEGNELDSFADWDYVEWAVPSPSGRYLLAFGSRMEPGTPSNLTALWWVDLISREAFPITGIDPFAVQRRSVAWLPTHDTAVIVEQGGGGNSLHRLESDLVPFELLASITGDRFDISEDGSRLLFSDHVAGDPQIFELLIASGEATQLTNDNNGRELPTYGPGDRWFAARSDCCDIGLFDLDGRLMHDTFMYAGTLLNWSQDGRLVGIDSSLVSVLTPAGLFEQPMTALVLGLNTITAQSVDAFDNISEASPAIEVTWNAVGFPDLSLARADAGAVPQAVQVGDTVRITAVLRNLGDAIAEPTELSYVLYDNGGDEIDAAQLTVPPIAAGGSYTLVREVEPLSVGNHQMVVIADPSFALAESNENNNLVSIGFNVVEVGGQLLTLRADAPVFTPEQTPAGSVTVANAGPIFDGTLVVRVMDAFGYTYPWSLTQSIDALGFAEEVTFAFEWPNAGFSGAYQFEATLFDSDGAEIDQTLVGFEIAEQAVLSLSVSANDNRFVPGALVDLQALIAFEQGNVVLSDPQLAWRAMASDGTVVWSDLSDLPTMLPGYQGTAAKLWSLSGVAIGDYRVQAVLRSSRPDVVSEILLTVSEPDPVVAVAASLDLSTQRLARGAELNVDYQVVNVGTTDLIDVPIELRVVRSNDLTTVQTVPQQVSLTPGQSQSFAHSIDSLPLHFENYSVIVSATLPGQTRSDLASSTFGVIDANPPVVSVVSPMAGSIQSADVLLVVDASDRWSPISSVDLWQLGQPLALGQHGLDGYYQRWLFNLPEGLNQIELTATDSWGNRSEPLVSSFTVDRTAPLIDISGVVDGELRNTVATPVITITDLHLDQSNIQLNGQPFVSGTSIAADGSYLLSVVATDLAGNRSSESVTFTIDRTPPNVLIDYPVDGDTLDVSATVVNGHTEALADVILTVNGIDYPTQAGADGVWLIASVPLLEGPNVLTATATDAANNTGPASAVTVHFDAAQPALAGALINVAAELPVTEPATVEFTVENTGNVDFVAQGFTLNVIELSGAGLLATHTLSRDLVVGESAVLAHVFDTTAWPLGAIRVELRSDVAGTPTLLDSAGSVVVDRLPPTLSLIQPADASTHGPDLTVDGMAFDVHSPLQAVTVSVDGGAPLAMVLVDAIGHVWQQQLTGLSHGPHTVAMQATDQVGNVAQSTVHAFDVDAEAPVISITGVSDGGLYNHAVTPLIDITDANPGVSSVELNGSTFVSGTAINVDGVYTLSVQSTDQFGNASAREIQFTVDQTPPVVTITEPVDGFATLAQQVNIAGVTEGQAQVELLVPARLQATGGDGLFQFDNVPLTIGNNVFSLRATDLAGNVGAPVSLTVVRLAGSDLGGSITQLADTALRGDNLPVAYELGNTGDVDVLALPVRILAQQASTPVAEIVTSIDLPVGSVVSPLVAFDTSDWPVGNINLLLQIDPPDDGDDQWLTMDADSVLLTEILPLTIANPGNGASVPAGTVALNGITRPFAEVELLLASEPPRYLQADLAGLFTFEQVPVEVGLNSYQLQASDAIGSTSPWLDWQLIGLAGPELAGEVTGLVDAIVRDEPLNVEFELSNTGDVDVSGLPVRIIVQQGGDLIDLMGSTADLPIDSTVTQTAAFDTKTWPTGLLTVGLQIEQVIDGSAAWITLDTGEVLVTEILPLTVSYPAYGESILAGTTELRGHSRAGAVVVLELTDGQTLSTLVGTDGSFDFERVRVSVGDNNYRLQASDAMGSISDWLDWLVIGLAGSDVDGEITDVDKAVLRGEPLTLSYLLTNDGDVDVFGLPLRVLVRHQGTDIDQQVTSHDLPADSQLLGSMELATDSWPTGVLEVVLQMQPPEKGDNGWVTLDGADLLLTEILPLTITSPEQGAQVPVGVIDLVGQTAPSAQVELVLPGGEALTTAADQGGLFEFEQVPVLINQNDYQLQASDEVGSSSEWLDWRLIGVVVEPFAIPGVSSPMALMIMVLLLLAMTVYERMGTLRRRRLVEFQDRVESQGSAAHE